ncbi:E3 ubiquitin-protein ligase ZFP91-like isoform X2 [Oxyura jamaicensis]|uniref:E3 ubiquitin-protein ligase ZFP91-like isoform X2 n=1 Tax=Oxyura jamaicensis TaxID=8884 RepID=UPI0015A608BD|nr:E3 ubiquitin-protein ligase ZFP91-like isoform X2 [Oxyura jamaicensis]XP_035167608.1 E3 ubiquitin-protein ligase ZFP91-like isoform X2 [Oxyura jamaicensis]
MPAGGEEGTPGHGPPAAPPGRRRPAPGTEPGEDSGGSRVLRGGRDRGRASAAAASASGAAAASRRRKAEYPRRRRSSPGARGAATAAEQPAAEPQSAARKGAPRLGCTDKAAGKDPKEEKEEEEVSSPLSHGSAAGAARPSRSWRSSRSAATARQRDTENLRASRSKTGSLQLVCKSEPNVDQLEYEVTEEHQSPAGISDDEEEILVSEEEVPFKDDPRDETYKPHLEKETPKQRRKAGKAKEEKEKQKEIKVEVKEESEFHEDEEPPRKRGRRRKDDKSPRLPKRRKKPPIQYVRCEMEGCGTVLAHPRYLQHHIKYQHLLKKKYVCPHPSCGRLFRLQKQLLRHAKHHTDQRDYICEYCARAFKSSHNLAVHRMIHTGEKPLQCEICGFTCRQKASLNWHMKKHDADSFYQFSCNICGKKFEKKDSVVAHKAKSHPEVLIAEALAANAGALITSTDILGTNPEAIAPPTDGQGLPLLPDPLGSAAPADCLLLNPDGMPKTYCGGAERVSLVADGKLFVGSGSSATPEGLVMNTEILGATTEVLIEDSDSTGP